MEGIEVEKIKARVAARYKYHEDHLPEMWDAEKWALDTITALLEELEHERNNILSHQEHVAALTAERDEARNAIIDLETELDAYSAWVDDLQSGMYVNCVYCGHRYGPGETTSVSMADALKAHIEQCLKHPMSALTARVTALEGALEAVCAPDQTGLCHYIDPVALERARAALRATAPKVSS